jgi:N utilization substance protein A
MCKNMVQTDILSALRQLAAERKVEFEVLLEITKDAIAYSFGDDQGYERENLVVEIEPEEGYIGVFTFKEVVKKVEDDKSEITLENATKLEKKAKLGDKIKVDITPKGDFGRIAAQAARQILFQKLREAEKDAVIQQYKDKVGTIVNVVVQRVTQEGDVICELNKARALMPKNERIMTEFYKLGGNLRVLLKEINEDDKGNKVIVVSRSDGGFLNELFKMEVPEIESGTVEIVSIAREAGSRSKVAVRSMADGVDPIGACVGQKGVRINAITNELKNGSNEEKIDIILWDEEIETFLMNAIRPAESMKVLIGSKAERSATIVVPESQYSLAIGIGGQNARLANKLTGWKIDIMSDVEFEAQKGGTKNEVVEEEATEEEAEVKPKKEKKTKAKAEKTEKKETKKPAAKKSKKKE